MSRAAPLRALLVGFGNVGRAVAEVLTSSVRYPGLDLDVSVVGIATGTHGALVEGGGLNLGAAMDHWRRHGGFTTDHPSHSPATALDLVRDLDYDVMVELTPLARRLRGEPAISHVREALQRRRHAITANKGPVAWAFRDLRDLARARGTAFLYETTVMDGVPVFNLARHGLRGATVSRIEGILNSTTNVVLGALEAGGTVSEATARAQREGFAEADPADDLEGWDGAVKVAALANALMDGGLAPEAVEREGLIGLDPARPASVRARGARLKLVCEAWRDGAGVRGRVALREVPRDDPFALVEGASSILRLVTDLAGTIVVTEERPDIVVTAYGVISDLLVVADL